MIPKVILTCLVFAGSGCWLSFAGGCGAFTAAPGFGQGALPADVEDADPLPPPASPGTGANATENVPPTDATSGDQVVDDQNTNGNPSGGDASTNGLGDEQPSVLAQVQLSASNVTPLPGEVVTFICGQVDDGADALASVSFVPIPNIALQVATTANIGRAFWSVQEDSPVVTIRCIGIQADGAETSASNALVITPQTE